MSARLLRGRREHKAPCPSPRRSMRSLELTRWCPRFEHAPGRISTFGWVDWFRYLPHFSALPHRLTKLHVPVSPTPAVSKGSPRQCRRDTGGNSLEQISKWAVRPTEPNEHGTNAGSCAFSQIEGKEAQEGKYHWRRLRSRTQESPKGNHFLVVTVFSREVTSLKYLAFEAEPTINEHLLDLLPLAGTHSAANPARCS